MNYEILEALSQITKDKNIDMDFVIESLEAGLVHAAKKKFGNAENIKIDIDRKSGEIKITASRKVVKEAADPGLEIALTEAKKVNPKAKVEDEMEVDIGFEEFGRNAILAAKQILIQKVREAERDMIYEEYKDKIEDIVTGSVQQVDKGNLLVNLGGERGLSL